MRRKHRKNPDNNTTLLIVALAAIGAGVYLYMQNKDKDKNGKDDEGSAPPKIPQQALPPGTHLDNQGNLVESATGDILKKAQDLDSWLKKNVGKGIVDLAKDLYNWATNGMVSTHGVSGYTDFGDPEVPVVKVSPYGYPQYGYASYRTLSGRI